MEVQEAEGQAEGHQEEVGEVVGEVVGGEAEAAEEVHHSHEGQGLTVRE